MSSYASKLKHPNWQKKRLLILSRDNWTCLDCRSKDKQLHVHHLVYNKNGNPWDVPDDWLVTVCFDCHKRRHSKNKILNKKISKVFKNKRKYRMWKDYKEKPKKTTSKNNCR